MKRTILLYLFFSLLPFATSISQRVDTFTPVANGTINSYDYNNTQGPMYVGWDNILNYYYKKIGWVEFNTTSPNNVTWTTSFANLQITSASIELTCTTPSPSDKFNLRLFPWPYAADASQFPSANSSFPHIFDDLTGNSPYLSYGPLKNTGTYVIDLPAQAFSDIKNGSDAGKFIIALAQLESNETPHIVLYGNPPYTGGAVPKLRIAWKDTTPPIVSIKAPLDNSFVSGSFNINIEASDPDCGINTAQVFIENVSIYYAYILPSSLVFDLSSYNPGAYKIKVRVSNNYGLFSDQIVTVIKSNSGLSGGTVVQELADDNQFKFSVNYDPVPFVQADSILVAIDGQRIKMTGAGPIGTQTLFSYESYFQRGTHTYWFETYLNGTLIDRYPKSGSMNFEAKDLNGWYPSLTGTGGELLSTFFVDSAIGFAVGQNNRIGQYVNNSLLKTTNGGKSWTNKMPQGSSDFMWCVQFPSKSIGYVLGCLGLQKTTDGGETWHYVTSTNIAPNFFGEGLCLLFINEEKGFSITRGIQKTTNGGASWTACQLPPYSAGDFLSIAFQNSLNGFAGRENMLYQTTDGGQTWFEWYHPPYTFASILRLVFRDSLNGFGPERAGRLAQTSDGGKTWQESQLSDRGQDIFAPSYSGICFLDTLRGFIVGHSFDYLFPSHQPKILQTFDGGTTWNKIVVGDNVDLASVAPAGNNAVFSVGENGTVLKYTRRPFPTLALISPNGGESFFTGTLQSIQWESLNIASLVIEYSGNGGQTWQSITTTNLPKGSFTWTVPATESNHYRIRIRDASDPTLFDISDYDFSAIKPVAIPAIPTLIEPNDGSSNISVAPMLKWNPIEAAGSYHIQVSLKSDFSTIIFEQGGLNTNSVAVPSLEYYTTYYWRVNASNVVGSSGWSPTNTFTTTHSPIALPRLSSPPNGSWRIPTNPILWYYFAALRNRVQLSTDSNFSNITVDQIFDSPSMSFQVSGLGNFVTYYWRLKTYASNDSSEWSAIWNFLTAPPSPPISKVYPNLNATNVPRDSSISFILDSLVDATSLNQKSISVMGSFSGLYQCKLSFDQSSRKVTLTPKARFRTGERITITLNKTAKQANGMQIGNPFSFSFTTQARPAHFTFATDTIPISFATGRPCFCVPAAFDNNGTMGVAAADGNVSILHNIDRSKMVSVSTISTGNYLAINDIDKDGAMDVVATSAYTLSILYNDGLGKFSRTTTLSFSTNIGAITSGDFDNDGNIDLAFVASDSDSLFILRNNGDGTFIIVNSYKTGFQSRQIVSADIDGDGFADLLISSGGNVAIFISKGGGEFFKCGSISTPQSFIAPADFNGDGYIDFACGGITYLYTGNGSFAPTRSTFGGLPFNPIAADFDGDGYTDVATQFGPDDTYLEKNDGTGQLNHVSSLKYSFGSSSAAADFNQDGANDILLVGDPISGIPIVFRNQVDKSLSSQADTLDFGQVKTFNNKSIALLLQNQGVDSILNVSISVGGAQYYKINKSQLSLSPQSKDSVIVSISPESPGIFIDSLILISNDRWEGPKYVQLHSLSPHPTLLTSSTILTFGGVAKNTMKKDTVRILNTSINVLTLDSIYTKTSVFITDRTNGTVGTDTFKVIVSFMPTSFANYTDTLYLHSNSMTPLVKIPLSGGSQYPILVSSATQIDLGAVGVYDSAKTIVKFTNTSVNALIIDTIFTSTPSFSTSLKKASITKGDTVSATVNFSMFRFGSYADTLVIKDNAEIPTFRIPLKAYTPPAFMVVNPQKLSFGKVKKDTLSQLLISIVDTSISRLAVDSLVTGTKYFDVFKTLANRFIKKGDTVTTSIRFKPDTLRAYSDTLFIFNSSLVSPFKIPLDGNGVLTSVLEAANLIPDHYFITQNYPNPFNPSTMIEYGLPAKSMVRLQIFNIIGQQITRLYDGEQSAGYQKVQWNASVSTGIYIYRLEAISIDNPNNSFVQVKKMLLLK